MQRLARRLIGHLARGQLAEFIVNERKQFLRGVGVALFQRTEDAGDIAHAPNLAKRPTVAKPKMEMEKTLTLSVSCCGRRYDAYENFPARSNSCAVALQRPEKPKSFHCILMQII